MATFTVRIPDRLHARLKSKAEADHRSVNAEIVHLLETVLDSPATRDREQAIAPDSPPT